MIVRRPFDLFKIRANFQSLWVPKLTGKPVALTIAIASPRLAASSYRITQRVYRPAPLKARFSEPSMRVGRVRL